MKQLIKKILGRWKSDFKYCPIKFRIMSEGPESHRFCLKPAEVDVVIDEKINSFSYGKLKHMNYFEIYVLL